MHDCPFCRDNWSGLDIVLQTAVDGRDIAIINPLDPVTEGHVLVIGATHTESAADDPVQAAALVQVAASYVRHRGIEANIITSVGPAATQTVRHTHLHIVPRRESDGLALPWSAPKRRGRRKAQ